MNLQETYALFAMMTAVHPNHPATDETARVYAELLADVSFADAATGVKHLLKTSSFFPKPAEIIEAAKSEATGLPDPSTAWAQVERAMLKSGYYGRPSWSHPAIHATIRAMGGWQEVCRSEDVDKLKRRFTSQYKTLRDSWSADDAPALPEPAKPKTLDELMQLREERWAMVRDARNAAND